MQLMTSLCAWRDRVFFRFASGPSGLRLEMQFQGFCQICQRFLLGLTLTGYINFQALRDYQLPSRQTVAENGHFIEFILSHTPPGCTVREQVLRFVASLVASGPTGESGTALRHFSGSLDPVAAQEIAQAIEEHCERVDVAEW